mgnify:CR=1 FL=1
MIPFHGLNNLTTRLFSFSFDNLKFFLTHSFEEKSFENEIERFALLDDYDIFQALKMWMHCDDTILQTLSTSIVNRTLFKIEFLEENAIENKYKLLENQYNTDEMKYLVLKGSAQNNAYNPNKDNIYIKFKKNIKMLKKC